MDRKILVITFAILLVSFSFGCINQQTTQIQNATQNTTQTQQPNQNLTQVSSDDNLNGAFQDLDQLNNSP